MGRLTLVTRIGAGRPVAHVAAEMGISRPTAYKWWRRFNDEGIDGLVDRSSRPKSCPHQTPPLVEAQILELRRTMKRGPARLAPLVGLPASTIYRVLRRHGMNRLSWMDRPTGRVIRRIHTDRPGELVHVDIKKLGRIPEGGGWRTRGRGYTNEASKTRRVGYAYIHAAVDAYSRLAYAEVLDNEQAATAVGFWGRAEQWFDQHGITVEAVLTDNGSCYRSHAWRDALHPIEHRRTRPRRPQTNGKVERFNRTLLDEWAYIRPYTSETERTNELDNWLHLYNHHRHHTAIDGPPINRVNNLPDQYS